MTSITSHSLSKGSKTIRYLTTGPSTGPLLIFVHGWPGLAATWKPQLQHFSSLGYLCVAADTEGYGKSSNSRNLRDYSCESLVGDQLALLAHLERKEAVWIGHDWGSPIVWSLAAHHPEACVGVVNLCVPYRTLELGLTEILTTINRDIYPAKEYPYGQWDYQVFYEESADEATKCFDENVSGSVKAFFVKGSAAGYGKPARTAAVVKNGGWFGRGETAPDIPLSATCLDAELHRELTESLTRNGFWGATAYYLNHDVNRPYNLAVAESNKTLKMPVLFVDARWDHVCANSCSSMSEPMRKYCANLTEVSVEAGHWVASEKPEEVNTALSTWLKKNLPKTWPGN